MALRQLASACLAALALAACTTQEINIVESDPQGFAAWDDDTSAHRLGTGDRVRFDFTFTPEMNEEALVAPDGYIGLKAAGRIKAQGLSVTELQEVVATEARKNLLNPRVVASLSDARSTRVVVGGAVKKPGVFLITARPTVYEAVTQAEGMLGEGRMTEVVLLRLRNDNTAMLRKVNLNRFLATGDPRENPKLLPEDMIFVPRSRIAEVNWWIEQYINRNLPFGRQITYTKNQEMPLHE